MNNAAPISRSDIPLTRSRSTSSSRSLKPWLGLTRVTGSEASRTSATAASGESDRPVFQACKNDASGKAARAFATDPLFAYMLPEMDARWRLCPWFFATCVRYGCRFGEAWAVLDRPDGELIGTAWWQRLLEADFTTERVEQAGFGAAPVPRDAMLGPAKSRRLDQPIAVSLEDLVPADNFYRHVEARLDLSFVREWTQGMYAQRGRPSIDPVVFFKLQLIMFFEGIRSERQVIETASLDLVLD